MRSKTSGGFFAAPPAASLRGSADVVCRKAQQPRLGLRKRSGATRRGHAPVIYMDQTQPAGEGRHQHGPEQLSVVNSGSAARPLSRQPKPLAAVRRPRASRATSLATSSPPGCARRPMARSSRLGRTPLLRPDQAGQKYEEASAVAVNACAEDTKGQTCWICFDDGSKEGLRRWCSDLGGLDSRTCRAWRSRRRFCTRRPRITIWTACWMRGLSPGRRPGEAMGVVNCRSGGRAGSWWVGQSWARLIAMSKLGKTSKMHRGPPVDCV